MRKAAINGGLFAPLRETLPNTCHQATNNGIVFNTKSGNVIKLRVLETWRLITFETDYGKGFNLSSKMASTVANLITLFTLQKIR